VASPSQQIIPTKEANLSEEQLMFWISMNTFFIFIIAFHFLNLARVYESFASFVRMCLICLYSIQDFMLFLLFWIFIFGYLFKTSGSIVQEDSDKEDYKDLNGNVKQLFEAFRNTLGDFQMPSYDFWNNQKSSDKMMGFSYVMIYYIWALWCINTLFMCVVLLNLLIAVLSSAYEEALSDNFTQKYRFRCQMISEATLNKEAITWMFGIERSQIFCLSYSILKDEEEDEASQSQTKLL
jgi:hypothetical protein